MEAALNGPTGRINLGPNTLTIGRLPDNQLVTNDPKTSSRHAEIRPEGQGYSIIDKNSTNGTFVNDQMLESNVPRMLKPGDRIRFGDTNFTYEASNAPRIERTMLAQPNSGNISTYGPAFPGQPPNTGYGSGAPQEYIPSSPDYPSYQPYTLPSQPAYQEYTPPGQPSYTPPQPAQSSYMPPPQPSYIPPPQAAQQQPYMSPPQSPGYQSPTPPSYAPPGASGTFANYAPPVVPVAPQQGQTGRQGPFKGRPLVLIGLAVLALVIVVASIGIFFVVHNNQVATDHTNATSTAVSNTHATATGIANVTATAVTNPYAPHMGTLALFDPLTDNSKGNGWIEQSGSCQFTGGAYHVSEAKQNIIHLCRATAPTFSNLVYQTEMTIVNGDCGGMIFRADFTNGNFYIFEVCRNGTYNFYSINSGKLQALINAHSSAAIKAGTNQTNLLAVVANASSMMLYVNNQSIDSVTNSSFSQGQIALIADDNSNSTEVLYNNVKVWKL